MVTVYIVDCEESNNYCAEHKVSGLEFNPTSERFNPELFKKIACISKNIHAFVHEFNMAGLDIDDNRYYIYLEI